MTRPTAEERAGLLIASWEHEEEQDYLAGVAHAIRQAEAEARKEEREANLRVAKALKSTAHGMVGPSHMNTREKKAWSTGMYHGAKRMIEEIQARNG